MAQKKKVIATVVEQKQLASGIFDMWLKTELAEGAKCGQFIGVYPEDKSNLLPRPISICEVNKEEGMLRIVYRVAGEGTEEFSHYEAGKEVPILGILGNGFPVEEGKEKKLFLWEAESECHLLYSWQKNWMLTSRQLLVTETITSS